MKTLNKLVKQEKAEDNKNPETSSEVTVEEVLYVTVF